MFTEEGVWKEFGIGRNPATHTWLPFWLFAIMWAIISYILSLVLVRIFSSSSPSTNVPSGNVLKTRKKSKNVVFEEATPPIESNEGSLDNFDNEGSLDNNDQLTSLPTGYYVLNTTSNSGNVEPKYVYLGKRLPKN